jgi:hypothetical protein
LTRALLGETPFAGHLVNHALHLANCLLAYLLLRPRIGGTRAGVTIAAWNVLPQLAFSLGWIAQRNDPLLTVFLLASILLHDRGHKWLAWLTAFSAFLSKVTAVAFPLAFVARAGLRRFRGDRTAGWTMFGTAVLLSAIAIHDMPVRAHLAGVSELLRAINLVKAFVLGVLGWWIPVPFFAGPLEIAGWAVCIAATGWLLVNYGRRTEAVDSLAAIALLLALPFAMNAELRISYTFSLFAIAAVAGAIDPPEGDRRAKIAIAAALLGLTCYGVPATALTLDGFRSEVRDLAQTPPHQDAYDAYPVPFYRWVREWSTALVDDS